MPKYTENIESYNSPGILHLYQKLGKDAFDIVVAGSLRLGGCALDKAMRVLSSHEPSPPSTSTPKAAVLMTGSSNPIDTKNSSL